MTETANQTTINLMRPGRRIYVAGYRALVGSAIHRELLRLRYRIHSAGKPFATAQSALTNH